MSYDLSNHFPYGPEEGFEEAGYTFKAWQPANDKARRQWVVRAFKDDELVREIVIQMWHTNIFGPDIEDVAILEDATDKLIQELTNEPREEGEV